MQNKNQHWVPQFYLRYFATPESRDTDSPEIWAFPIKEGEEFSASLKGVAAQRYLYSPIDLRGGRDDSLDEWLQELESTMGKLWPRIADDHYPLDDAFRHGMSIFIATLFLRHPSKLDQHRQFHRTLVDAVESAPLDADGRPAVHTIEMEGKTYPIDWSDWEHYQAATENDVKASWVQAIVDHGGYFAKTLVERQPWSMVFAEEPAFVTSDHPVTLYHPEIRRPNLNVADATVYLPISPTRLLVIGDRHFEDGKVYPLKRGGEGLFNYHIFRSARKFMFSPWHPARTLAQIVEFDERMRAEEEARWEGIAAGAAVLRGKVARNEPCPCGSGVKFKRCCGRLAT